MYRLIAIDLDGTLLSPGHRLSDRNRAALNALLDRERHVVVATGRPFDIVRIHCAGVDLRGPQITYNGAVVYDPESDRVLSQDTLPPQHVPQILAFLKTWDVPAVACRLGQAFLDPRISHPGDWAAVPDQDATVLPNMARAPRDGLIKIVGESDPETIARIRPIAMDAFVPRVYVTQTAPSLIEFLSPAASKGNALREIANRLGVLKEDIVAFGDSHNDLTMFDVAGLSVAMGNASDEVKDAADRVAPSNDEDGVASVLLELGLIGRAPGTWRAAGG